jgi:hypothetical protein
VTAEPGAGDPGGGDPPGDPLAGLHADATRRAPDPPGLGSVIEDAGRQRLAAYYLYCAIMAEVIGCAGLRPALWPPALAEPMQRLGLERFAPRTERGLRAELTPAEQSTCRDGGTRFDCGDQWELVAQQLASAPHGDDPLAGMEGAHGAGIKTRRLLERTGISHGVSTGLTLAVHFYPLGTAAGIGTSLVWSRIQTGREQADALRRLGAALVRLRDQAGAERSASPPRTGAASLGSSTSRALGCIPAAGPGWAPREAAQSSRWRGPHREEVARARACRLRRVRRLEEGPGRPRRT